MHNCRVDFLYNIQESQEKSFTVVVWVLTQWYFSPLVRLICCIILIQSPILTTHLIPKFYKTFFLTSFHYNILTDVRSARRKFPEFTFVDSFFILDSFDNSFGLFLSVSSSWWLINTMKFFWMNEKKFQWLLLFFLVLFRMKILFQQDSWNICRVEDY